MYMSTQAAEAADSGFLIAEDQVVQEQTSSEFQAALAEGHLYVIGAAVRSVHLQRGGGGLDIEEARLDAAEGVAQAVARYDPTREVPFEVYALPRAKGNIIDGERRLHKLSGTLRHEATAVSQLNNTNARSMDAPVSTYNPATLHHVLPTKELGPEEVVMAQFESDHFYWQLHFLTPRQRRVVLGKVHQMTLAEIAMHEGISERTVSRDWRVAKTHIRENYERSLFDD